MARIAKLKVYVTPIGFHDAYVAAPSQKAALAAWGSDHDLFGRGVATIVTDPSLTAEPLANPGQVVKRLRGSAAEQLAALPPDKDKSARAGGKSKPAPPATGRPKGPPPDRKTLDAARAALTKAEDRTRSEEKVLAEERVALERKQAKQRAAARDKLDRLRDGVETAEADYRKALRHYDEN